MKNTLKTIISLILVIVMLFSVCSCAIKGTVDSVKEAKQENTLTTNHTSSDVKADTDVIAETKEEFLQSVVAKQEEAFEQELEATDEPEFLTEEQLQEFLRSVKEFDIQATLALAVECIAYDIHEAGYEVFEAYAVIDGKLVPGLAYTRYEAYEEAEERTIYSCGFVQLIEEVCDTEIIITSETVQNGVVVIPNGEYDTTTGFVITLGASIPSFSGISQGYYFRYEQVSDYAMSISIKENDRSVWTENVDLYNFDEQKYVFKQNMTYHSTNASPYFSDEAKAYERAKEIVNEIIDLQNQKGYSAKIETIVLFSEDVINEYLLSNQKGSINGFLLEKINEIKLNENEILVITAEGVSKVPVIDKEAIAEQRVTNGIIGLIGGLLLTVGSIVVTVMTYGATSSLTIAAIGLVTGACATLYGISNIIESAHEIILGATGNITDPSFNPLLEAFKLAIDDDELATKIYHIWGLSNTVVQSLLIPANAALMLSRATTTSVWKIGLAIGRAVVVESVKIAISGLVAAGVGYATNELVIEITGNENLAKLLSFGSSIVAGAFTYNLTNKIDARFNFSGIKKGQIPNKQKQVDEPDSRYTKDNGRSKTCEEWTRDDYLNNIDDPDLKHTAEKLYRENAQIGDGGTADAVRYTKQTGELVGGKDHIIKAQEMVTHLNSLMKSGKLSYHDMKIAQSLISDLIHSLRFIP